MLVSVLVYIQHICKYAKDVLNTRPRIHRESFHLDASVAMQIDFNSRLVLVVTLVLLVLVLALVLVGVGVSTQTKC